MTSVDDLKKLLETDPNPEKWSEWVTYCIRATALSILDLNKDLCLLRKEVRTIKWFTFSVIVMIVIDLLKT